MVDEPSYRFNGYLTQWVRTQHRVGGRLPRLKSMMRAEVYPRWNQRLRVLEQGEPSS